MPKMKITKSSIDKDMPLTTKGTVDYWDSGDGSLKGFAVRCGTESKTFFVQTDVKTLGGYKTVKSVIGKYGASYTCEQAKIIARERLSRLKQGTDAIDSKIITLEEMVSKHLELKDFAKNTEYSYVQMRKKLNGWMLKPINEVSELEPMQIVERHKQIAEEHGIYAATSCFLSFQSVMNNAQKLYPKLVTRNPCQILTDGKYWAKSRTRTDCLHGGDFRKFHDAVMSFNEVFRDAYLVCLYSGLRSSEASSIRWDYVDMGNATLLIPTTKSGEPLHVPLSTQTVKILQHRQSANTGKSPYVFPAQSEFNKGGHVILKSGFLQLKTGLKITVHGLRRSFVDVADNKLKHRRQDVDRLTNHVDSTVTGRHYSHKDVEDLRPVIQAICDKLEHLLLNGAVD